MSREQERIRKRLEKNPIVECNKIQKKFCPELFSMFGEVADPRHQSYIKYSARTMPGTLYYKSIAGISSMQEMTRAFNDEKVCKNLYGFIGEDENLTVRSSVQSHWNGSSHFQKTAVCQKGWNEVRKKS